MTQPTTQPTDLKHWQVATDALATQATAQLANQLAGLDWSTPNIQTVVTGIYGAIVTAYRRSSSVLSLQMYGDLRNRAEITGRPPRIMAPDPSMDWIGAKVDSAFLLSDKAKAAAAKEITAARTAMSGPKFGSATAETGTRTADTVTTDTASAADQPININGADLVQNVVSSRLQNSVQRMVASGGRETVAINAAEDGAQYTHAPTKPGASVGADPAYYVRIPTSMKPCAFCVMMATRDEDWRPIKTAQAAEFVVGTNRGVARGKQNIGDRWHDHCQCIAVPIFTGKELPFDRVPYAEMYAKAAAQAGNRRTKDVLAAMRQIYGIA